MCASCSACRSRWCSCSSCWSRAAQALPRPPAVYWPWVLQGAIAQIAATALMLAAMSDRSFVVVYRLHQDRAGAGRAVRPGLPRRRGHAADGGGDPDRHHRRGGDGAQARHHARRARPTLLGLAAGGMFALSAVGYRGAILSLGLPSYRDGGDLHAGGRPRASSACCCRVWLWLREPEVLGAIARHWRPSLLAGFLGALASQFWFLAFALATAASVRTLALVEVLFAQAISSFVFKQTDHAARGARHRADRDRRRAAGVGVLTRLDPAQLARRCNADLDASRSIGRIAPPRCRFVRLDTPSAVREIAPLAARPAINAPACVHGRFRVSTLVDDRRLRSRARRDQESVRRHATTASSSDAEHAEHGQHDAA